MISVDVCWEEEVDKRSQKKVRTSEEEPCQYFESERLQRCDLEMRKQEIELKSLILAQIERWGMLYTCKSNGSMGATLMASGERVSNISERAQEWGTTSRKIG